tara:strand:+ start:1215 stop:1481 length:267 start_codon:yes stop_codon:yes gene_type:complete
MEEEVREGNRQTDGGDTWSSDGGVTIELPDGTTESRGSVSGADIEELARNSGIRKFHVKNTSGGLIQKSSFPLTSGRIKIEEYNEAKV